MENITTSDGFYGANQQNLPDFVQKLTADSITHGNMSAVLDGYGAMSGSSHPVAGSHSATGSPGLARSISMPAHLMEAPTDHTPISSGAKPKIKKGNATCTFHSIVSQPFL